MMESHNIMICPRCKLRVIAEEMDVHECRHETNRKIIRNVLGFLMPLLVSTSIYQPKPIEQRTSVRATLPRRMINEDLFAIMNSIFSS
jgi:hypothetical protein